MELGFKVLHLLAVAVASMVSGRGNGVGGGGGDNGLTGGLGQLVLNIGTGDLGDGVAVLNLDGDLDDLGVVNAVLGGDLTASVLHGLGDGVGNSVGNGQRSNGMSHSNGGSDGVGKGKTGVGEVLGISISLGLSLPLAVVANEGSSNGSVTEGVNDLLAHLLVLDLLGGDGLGGADLLGSGGADLGDQDHILSDTGGGRGSVVGDGSHWGSNGMSQRGGNGVASIAEELSVSLSIGVSSRGGASEGSHAGKGENLGCLLSPDCELDVSDAAVLTLEFILNWMTSHDGSS